MNETSHDGPTSVSRRSFLLASTGLLLPNLGWSEVAWNSLLCWKLNDTGNTAAESVTGTEGIPGVPVQWFQHHAVVNRKQFASQIKKSSEREVQFVCMGTATAETIYTGRRPDFLRIYNKLAEWLRQHRKLEIDYNRYNKHMEGLGMSDEQRYYGCRIPPTFKEFCNWHGYQYREGSVLTRIERQISGDRIPRELRTLGDLRFADELVEPFKGLKIVGGEPIAILNSAPEGVPIRDFLAALGMNRLVEHFGSVQLAEAFIRRNANGNGKRVLEALEKGVVPTRQALTIGEINETFRRSTLAQTSPRRGLDVYSTPTYDATLKIA